jgi:hypothetical protein
LRDLWIGWHAWQLLGVIGMFAREYKPLGSLGVSGDRLGTVARLDSFAVRADCLCFFPGAHPLPQDLQAVFCDKAALGMFHRGLPLPLPFGVFALLRQSAFFGFGRLEFEFAH